MKTFARFYLIDKFFGILFYGNESFAFVFLSFHLFLPIISLLSFLKIKKWYILRVLRFFLNFQIADWSDRDYYWQFKSIICLQLSYYVSLRKIAKSSLPDVFFYLLTK